MTDVRVVVADDQALVRAGFRAILDSAGGIDVVGEAADGVEAVEASKQHQPDVLLLDIRMPRLNGLDAARLVLQTPDPPRVVMLTTFDLDEYVACAMRLGASGFLLKDTPRDQLVAAVRTVVQGDALLSPSITRRLLERTLHDPAPDLPPADLRGLSPRELDVLRLLARGHSNTEIASELYVSENTVRTHVAHVLDKIEVRDRVQAVVWAYRCGVVQPGEE